MKKVSSLEITPPGVIIDFPVLHQQIPVSDRKLRQMVRDGVIPSIRLPGSRRVLFHWPNVQAALLRLQRGGAE